MSARQQTFFEFLSLYFSSNEFWYWIALPLLPMALLISLYARLSRIPWKYTGAVALLGVLSSFAARAWWNYQYPKYINGERLTMVGMVEEIAVYISMVAIAFLPLLITVAIQLWREKIRINNWLLLRGSIGGATLAGSFAYAFDCSFITIFAMLVLVLFSKPLANLLLNGMDKSVQQEDEPTRPQDPMSSERQRVVDLLEKGQISSEECAELLNALSPPSVEPMETLPKSRTRILWLGAAIVLIGFFLPWLSCDLTTLQRNMTKNLQGAFARNVELAAQSKVPERANWSGQFPEIPNMNLGMEMRLTIYGGDMNRGLGWLILTLAIATSTVPALPLRLKPGDRRMISGICIGIAALFTLYILQGIIISHFGVRSLRIGLVAVMAGLSIQAAGLWGRPRSLPSDQTSAEASQG